MSEPISTEVIHSLTKAFEKGRFWGSINPKFENGHVFCLQFQFTIRFQDEAKRFLSILDMLARNGQEKVNGVRGENPVET